MGNNCGMDSKFDCLCAAATAVVMTWGMSVPLKVLFALCERYRMEPQMRELTDFLCLGFGGKIKDGMLTIQNFSEINVAKEMVLGLDASIFPVQKAARPVR